MNIYHCARKDHIESHFHTYQLCLCKTLSLHAFAMIISEFIEEKNILVNMSGPTLLFNGINGSVFAPSKIRYT
jgi:hypothetical protein